MVTCCNDSAAEVLLILLISKAGWRCANWKDIGSLDKKDNTGLNTGVNTRVNTGDNT